MKKENHCSHTLLMADLLFNMTTPIFATQIPILWEITDTDEITQEGEAIPQ